MLFNKYNYKTNNFKPLWNPFWACKVQLSPDIIDISICYWCGFAFSFGTQYDDNKEENEDDEAPGTRCDDHPSFEREFASLTLFLIFRNFKGVLVHIILIASEKHAFYLTNLSNVKWFFLKKSNFRRKKQRIGRIFIAMYLYVIRWWYTAVRTKTRSYLQTPL